jgi:hypothetical protein
LWKDAFEVFQDFDSEWSGRLGTLEANEQHLASLAKHEGTEKEQCCIEISLAIVARNPATVRDEGLTELIERCQSSLLPLAMTRTLY